MLLLCLLPLATAPTDAQPTRWLLEAGGLYQRYPQFTTTWGRGPESVYAVLPVQLRLLTRLPGGTTLYLGLQYRHRQAPVTLLQTYSSPPHYYYNWQTTRAVTTVAIPVGVGVPVAVRRLAPTPWRLDARLGLTVLRARYRLREYTTTTPGPEPFEPTEEVAQTAGDLPLDLGGRLGYGLNRHLELYADASASFSGLALLSLAFGRTTPPFGGGASLGLAYRF